MNLTRFSCQCIQQSAEGSRAEGPQGRLPLHRHHQSPTRPIPLCLAGLPASRSSLPYFLLSRLLLNARPPWRPSPMALLHVPPSLPPSRSSSHIGVSAFPSTDTSDRTFLFSTAQPRNTSLWEAKNVPDQPCKVRYAHRVASCRGEAHACDRSAADAGWRLVLGAAGLLLPREDRLPSYTTANIQRRCICLHASVRHATHTEKRREGMTCHLVEFLPLWGIQDERQMLRVNVRVVHKFGFARRPP